MRLAIDSSKLLYALGILFAAAALLYFVRDVVFGLSITVKAALLFLGFLAFLVAGFALEHNALDAVAFALGGVTYVVFVGYVVVRYSPGEAGTFLLLALSAALFVGLGYVLRAGGLTVPNRQARLAVVGLLVLSVVLVGADAVSGGVTYDFQTADAVIVAPVDTDDPVPYSVTAARVGTVTATNPSPFMRALALPTLSGCLAGVETVPREDVWVNYDYESGPLPDSIAGGTTRELPVFADFPVDVNETASTTYAVERGEDCDVERDSPTLIVSVTEGRLD